MTLRQPSVAQNLGKSELDDTFIELKSIEGTLVLSVLSWFLLKFPWLLDGELISEGLNHYL